ncbi:AAA family ATPase [Bacteroides sp. UBA939]|uniref:AAA family ATPase n=1 Tax=Bacteroides sp. UBA939 TaxID=1946092 RepID=UPI0025BA0C3F|nr:ATP-binding protein [Bacteroides sp. UBA939]
MKELEGENEDLNNVFTDNSKKVKYLKSAAIYGANGSGKSNLFSALSFFRAFILNSSRESLAEEEIKVTPFLFSSLTEKLESSFEMIFMIEDTRYRYGFEVTKNEIVSEWLFFLNTNESTRESNCFTREYQEIKVNSKTFREGKDVETRTRKNTLFLSSVAQWNGEKSILIQNWFKEHINILSGDSTDTVGYTVNKFLNNPTFKKTVIDFIRLVDVGIEDIHIEEQILGEVIPEITEAKKYPKINSLISELQEELKKNFSQSGLKKLERKEFEITSYHKKYDEAMNLMELAELKFGLESAGTQRLFALLGPWFDTLENGSVLVIDEFGSNIHTKLSIELLKIFQSTINTTNAQLIFASHDTNLLRNDLFRRDQIWFTEKDSASGSSDLYSLVEYKINQATSVRNDASFEKDYLIGKYGAIPYFGDIARFVNEFSKTADDE